MLAEMEGVWERLGNRHMKVNGISFESAKAQFRMIKALEKEEICLILSEKQVDAQPFRKSADGAVASTPPLSAGADAGAEGHGHAAGGAGAEGARGGWAASGQAQDSKRA